MHRGDQDREQPSRSDEAATAEADRCLVAGHAGDRADQAERGDDERSARAGRRPSRCSPRPRPGTPRPSRAARSSPGCGRSRRARRPWPSVLRKHRQEVEERPGRRPGGRGGGVRPGARQRHHDPGDGRREAAQRRRPRCQPPRLASRSPQAERERAGDADAGGVAGDGARHHAWRRPGRPAASGRSCRCRPSPCRSARAVAIADQKPSASSAEQQMAEHRAADAEQIDALGVERSVSVTSTGTETM